MGGLTIIDLIRLKQLRFWIYLMENFGKIAHCTLDVCMSGLLSFVIHSGGKGESMEFHLLKEPRLGAILHFVTRTLFRLTVLDASLDDRRFDDHPLGRGLQLLLLVGYSVPVSCAR